MLEVWIELADYFRYNKFQDGVAESKMAYKRYWWRRKTNIEIYYETRKRYFSNEFPN